MKRWSYGILQPQGALNDVSRIGKEAAGRRSNYWADCRERNLGMSGKRGDF